MRKPYALERRAPYLVAFILMTTTASSTLAQTQSGGNNWSVFLTLRHTEAIDRVQNDIATADRIQNGADAGISFATRTQRSNVSFFGRVGANVSEDDRFQNQATYGVGFAWNYRTSSRSNMRLSQAFTKNLRLETLANLGVVPNDFNTTSATTTWSFQQQSGPRTSWSAGMGYQFTELRNLTPIGGSQIVLGEQPFGDEISIPLIDATEPAELELPDGEQEILRILATEGLTDRRARSQNAYLSFGLNRSIGRSTTLGFSMNGGYRSIDTRFAQDGATGRVQLFIQRALGLSSAASVGYTFQRSFVIDPNTTIQSLFVGWTYSPEDSSLSATLFGGASRYDAEGNPGTTQPVANASLAGNLTQSTTTIISYRRQFSMSLGFGRSLLIDYGQAGITQRFGTRVDASATIAASYGSDPLDEDSQLDTRRAGGALTVRIVGGLRLGTSYFYAENEQRTLVSGSQGSYKNWSLYLTYSADF